MTQSIATLGIRVTQQGAAEAERDLSKLATSGAKVEQQAARTAKGMEKTALSAKQLQAATRGLPAQFTDIATALGSGQRPLQVLLQQGGQIKDMFGGIGPAIRAMGGYVAGLVNPVTLAAAALVGLGYALYSAQARMEAFAATAIRTGDFAGTAEELRQLAAAVDEVAGVTSSKADDAVMAIARLGTVSKESAESAARATAAWAAASGDDVDTIAAKFGKLAEDPLRAIDALNRAEHFLTQEQRERIRVLIEEGNRQEAARVTIATYAASLESNANRVSASMSALGAAAKMMSDGMSEWWKSTRDGAALLANDTIEQLARVSRAMGNLSYFSPYGVLLRGAQAASDRAASLRNQPQGGGGNAVDSRAAAAADAAVEALQASAASYQTAAERIAAKKKEINDAAEAAERAGLTARALAIRVAGGQVLAAMREQAEKEARARSGGGRRAAPSGPSDASIQSARDRFNDMVGRFKSELEGPLERVEQNHLRNMRELEQAAKQGKVSHEDLAAALAVEAQAYAKSSKEVQNRLEAEVASLSGPVAQAEADHTAALRRIEELHASGAASGAQYNAMLAEEARAYGQAADAARRAADPIGALLDDMRAQIDLIGRTSAEQAVMNELRRQGISLMGDEAQAALAVARAYEQQAMDKQRVIDLMDGFRQSGVDAFTDFVTGAKSAKDAFRDFMDSIAEQITRAIAEKWISNLFGPMGSDGAGTSGGGWLASLLGGLFGGGRAIGGPVSAGRVYQVNERGAPEIYTAGGKQFLLAPRDGRVTPATAAVGGRASQINQTFVVNGTPDRMTRQQMLRMAGSETSRAIRRG